MNSYIPQKVALRYTHAYLRRRRDVFRATVKITSTSIGIGDFISKETVQRIIDGCPDYEAYDGFKGNQKILDE